MSFGRFLRERARYRHFLGDPSERDYTAEYEEYSLEGIGIREAEGWDAEGRATRVTVLYFFPAVSRCRDEIGADVPLPRCSRGDICVIGRRSLRVAEAEYFTDGGEGLCHVRLSLM